MNNDLNNLNNNITPQPIPNTDSLTPQPIPNPNPQQANPQPMSNTDLLTPQPIPGENQNLDTNQNTRSDQIISINSNNIIPDTNIKDSSIESKDNSLEKQTIEEPNPNNIIKESSINENTQTINKENNIINDEELLKAFIGNNYDKITTNKFNIAGFFLSTLYLFYRKMFGYGLLVFIINIILVSITNKTELTIILNIAVGLLVNRLYISFANSKIAIIKQNNLEKSNEELKNICTNKGGTSIFLPFLGIIVEIIISIIIFMILGLIGITTMFGSLLNSATSAKNGTFNGIFEYESGIKIEDEFTVTVPNRFENDSEDYIFSYRYESGNGVFNGCKFYLSPIRGYSNSQNLINQMIEYYKDSNPTPISQSTINGIKWDSFSKENELGKDYYYATIKNNQVYLIQYGIGKDTNSECDSYRMQIINSIRSK